MSTRYVCQRCGLNVGYWFYGWKHHSGGNSKKTCGQKPIPVRKASTTQPTTTAGQPAATS